MPQIKKTTKTSAPKTAKVKIAAPKTAKPTRATLTKASTLLKLLAHPVRLSLLCNLLHHGEQSVSALVKMEAGAASQSQISQFLAKMRRSGLVDSHKEGQIVYYAIQSPVVGQMLSTLDSICSQKKTK
jgi:DNA-binding transcriptional ArsR family regulator